MAYSSKAGYLSRSQMSSNCSTTGSSSSRGSTGSRGLNSARKHNEVGHSNANDFIITARFYAKKKKKDVLFSPQMVLIIDAFLYL